MADINEASDLLVLIEKLGLGEELTNEVLKLCEVEYIVEDEVVIGNKIIQCLLKLPTGIRITSKSPIPIDCSEIEVCKEVVYSECINKLNSHIERLYKLIEIKE